MEKNMKDLEKAAKKIGKKKMPVQEMIKLLEDKFGKNIFTQNRWSKDFIEIKKGSFREEGNFFDHKDLIDEDLEKFVLSCNGWQIKVTETQSMVVFPI
jgi:hypothetical protein